MAGFKTKARAIDLLGEMNIKDDTTAISELFKNAHDADADHAELSIDTKADSLILWDDGLGMDQEDVETKWLILGSDSKTSTDGKAHRTPKGRISMGEKGIGRLAIATLGKQMLLVTKKRGQPFVLVYLHWGVFGNTKLFLENTVIPLRTIESLSSSLRESVSEMLVEHLHNVSSSDEDVSKAWEGPYQSLGLQIESEIRGFSLEHYALSDYLQRLEHKGQGTLFFLRNLKERWASLVSPAQTTRRLVEKKKQLQVMITGFINTLELFDKKPEDTHYLDVASFKPQMIVDGDESSFPPYAFEAKDLGLYDYTLSGTVTGGWFEGTATVHGKEPEHIRVELTHGVDVTEGTDCGSYNVYVQTIEGNRRASRLNKESHEYMMDKLKAVGGIYVYRDGLRVLPYGTPEYDFLKIEEKRSKDLGESFLSIRRMFGYIGLTKEGNPKLQDKTNREGLRENPEYDYFITTLQNLMTWFSNRYLNREGRRTAHTSENNERSRREEELNTLEEKRAKDRTAFLRSLQRAVPAAKSKVRAQAEEISKEIQRRVPNRSKITLLHAQGSADETQTYMKTLSLLQDVEESNRSLRLKIARLGELDAPSVDQRFVELEEVAEFLKTYRETVREAKETLTQELSPRYEESQAVLSEVLQAHVQRLTAKLGTSAIDAVVEGMKRRVSQTSAAVAAGKHQAVSHLRDGLAARHNHYATLLKKQSDALQLRLHTEQQSWTSRIEAAYVDVDAEVSELERLVDRFATLDVNDDLAGIARELQSRSKDLLEKVAATQEEMGIAISQELGAFAMPSLDLLNSESVSGEEKRLIELYEARVHEMSKEIEGYRGLVATGLAAEIVNHEFEQQYDLIRALFERPSMRDLAKDYVEIGKLEDQFKHLQERHRLLSPLYRTNRMYRKKTRLYDFAEKVRDLFQARLDLYRIDLQNDIPKNFFVQESDPILYPAFINIINNSVYWLLNRRDRVIRLRMDKEQRYLYLEDNGSGIDPEQAPRVFDLFYSTRTDGRGIGLHLVKELLTSRGHDVVCVTDPMEKALDGASFRIQFAPGSVLTER